MQKRNRGRTVQLIGRGISAASSGSFLQLIRLKESRRIARSTETEAETDGTPGDKPTLAMASAVGKLVGMTSPQKLASLQPEGPTLESDDIRRRFTLVSSARRTITRIFFTSIISSNHSLRASRARHPRLSSCEGSSSGGLEAERPYHRGIR